MEPWNAGIFSIMGMMVTIIGIVIATRFLYIDSHYSKMIAEQEKFVEKTESIMSEPEKDTGDADSETTRAYLSSFQRAIGFYRTKQNNNKKEGVIIDFLALFSIVILGLAAVQGFFRDDFLLLVFTLMILFSMPLFHFMTHIRTVTQKNPESL